ncbi:MAG: hypothetical protein ACOC5U_04155 [Candidatus Aminicenantaceae bacterium]
MFFLTAILHLSGCQTGENDSETPAEISSGSKESAVSKPKKVTALHTLIAFQGTIPEEGVTRTRKKTEAQPREYPRKGMVQDFGDISFSLEAGEIGMTEYDPEASKNGRHIIKRFK